MLDDNTPFVVWPGYIDHHRGGRIDKVLYATDLLDQDRTTVNLARAGTPLVFRGDLLHAGVA